MKRVNVSSSNLSSVGYDPERMILEIEFHGGRVYQYFGVPGSCFSALMSAPSHGKYFAYHIKNSYSYRRIS
ncbi:MAG: KTSC domain-containing protein [Magnetococcales bacterium]|nr:KTSC domain-containing protein [Magnetococcales bacterium]MBF0114711.1 KTSC domain-containing protein [Magnetococcales bacterium]